MQDEFSRTLSNINDSIDKLIEEVNYYRGAYADVDEAYKKYLQLNEKTKFALKGVFGGGENVLGFLSGALQESHLKDLFDYVQREFNSNKPHDEQMNILVELFDFAFEVVNAGFREPPYVRLDIKSGETFDSDTMTRKIGSPQIGVVSSVLLAGYAHRQGRIVKQSLVVIEN